jgi:hypothetical protein
MFFFPTEMCIFLLSTATKNGEGSAIHVAECLKVNSTLKHLDFGSNEKQKQKNERKTFQ